MIIVLIIYLFPFLCILLGILLLINSRANQHNETGSRIMLTGIIFLIVGILLLGAVLLFLSVLGE